jgi:hypothetical protein
VPLEFLIDECVSPSTVKMLRQLGHNVLEIKELNRFGLKDTEIYKLACQQNRVIFTLDKGFQRYSPSQCAGIIVSVVKPNTPLRYEPRLKHLLTTTHLDEIKGKLVLLEEKRHRFIKK